MGSKKKILEPWAMTRQGLPVAWEGRHTGGTDRLSCDAHSQRPGRTARPDREGAVGLQSPDWVAPYRSGVSPCTLTPS